MDTMLERAMARAFAEVFAESGFEAYTSSRARDKADNAVLSSVGITGGLKGHLMLGFDASAMEETAKRLAAPLGDPSLHTQARFQASCAGELANQVAGRLVNLFAEAGLNCHITPPSVLIGADLSPSMPQCALSAYLHAEWPFGAAHLTLLLRDMDQSALAALRGSEG
jgi:chemotaxis protein CheX